RKTRPLRKAQSETSGRDTRLLSRGRHPDAESTALQPGGIPIPVVRRVHNLPAKARRSACDDCHRRHPPYGLAFFVTLATIPHRRTFGYESLLTVSRSLMPSRGNEAMEPIVLCIDDRLELLELRKAALESSGFHVETATSGYAAIKILQETLVDAVLLEYKQQGIDAEAIAHQIHRRFPNVPIILLSAY